MNTESARRVRAFLALPLLAAASCAGETTNAAAPGADSVYIGVAAVHRTVLQPVFDAVRLAIDELNEERPAGAPPLALAMPPVEQPTQVAVAVGFRDDPRVVGVVGHTGSAQMLEAAAIYADIEHGGRKALVAVSPTATHPQVTRINDWVFRVCPTDADGARTLARFAADSLGASRVAIIYRNDFFGRGFSRAFAASLAALDAGAAIERHPYLPEITAFDAYAERMARDGVDLMVIAGGGSDAAEVMRAIRRAGASPNMIGSDDLAALNSRPDDALEFAGTRFHSFFEPHSPPTPEGVAFVRSFEARFGMAPDHRAALAYDAAMLIGRAVHEVGPDRRRVRDWIAQVGRGGAPYPGATGVVRFDEFGDPVDKPMAIGRVGG